MIIIVDEPGSSGDSAPSFAEIKDHERDDQEVLGGEVKTFRRVPEKRSFKSFF